MTIFIYDDGKDYRNYLYSLKASKHHYILTNKLQYKEYCDALLLVGGGHVTPYLYGSDLPPTNCDSLRDIAEYLLIDYFLKKQKRIVGICKGMQILNCFFGGNLSFINGHYLENKDLEHQVLVSGFVKDIFNPFVKNNCLLVNSCHQMKIDNLAKNLQINATSLDGTIEGVSDIKNNVYAVQFHPERLNSNKKKAFFDEIFSI